MKCESLYIAASHEVLLPLWFGTDGLIMQKLPQPPAWDELHLHGRAAKDLAAYIRRDHEGVNPNH